MTASATARLIALLAAVTALSGCLDDDRPERTDEPPVASENSPPVISGSPPSAIVAGKSFDFQPVATDPDGQKLTYEVRNKPRWSSFDSATGRLKGVPGSADVGEYAGITISASDGVATAELPSFRVTVRPPSSTSSPNAGFTFADVPEITFVRGFAERQNLGIWHIDAGNRWSPGDLRNESGWQPRVATQLEVIEGSLNGLSYDSSTAELSYDGAAAGGWARVRLVAPSKSAASAEFFVRIVVPDAIWGKDASSRQDIREKFPGVPTFDYGRDSYESAWASIAPNGSEQDPDVLLVLQGTYQSAVEAGLSSQEVDGAVQWLSKARRGERPWFYLLGEPGGHPKLTGMDARGGGVLQVPGYRVSVVRNLNLEAMVTATGGGGWLTGVPNRKYWSNLTAQRTNGMIRDRWPDKTSINDDVFGSDSPEGDTTDSYVRRGVPKAPNDWRSWFWNNRFYRTGGSSLKHTIYLHGRPDGWLIYNNNRHNGGNQSSAIKATVGHYRVLNSHVSAFADESNPGDPSDRLNQQLVDVPSSSDVVIYNNVLVGGRREIGGELDGTRTGLIWFNPRRSLWGTDDPRYPEVTFQAAPFRSFSFAFQASTVPGPAADVVAEMRRADGEWTRLTQPPQFRPNAGGGGSDWIVQVSPDEMPVDGKYEVRMRGSSVVTELPVTLTAARTARYFAVTSYADAGLDTPWYSSGPKAYLPDVGREYWQAMRDWSGAGTDGRTDPSNPYTSKKYVAYNEFVWLLHAALDDKREEAIRDNGSYPSSAVYVGSSSSRFGAVPDNWLDPGVTFLANNSYTGWRIEDMGTPAWRRSDAGTVSGNSGNMLYGPNQSDPAKLNWPHFFEELPVEKQPLFVEVGGERTPKSPMTAEVALPDWFRLF